MKLRVSIAGKDVDWKYTRLRGKADGYAMLNVHSHLPDAVLINKTLAGRSRLETEIHEFLHVANPTHSEEHVTISARDLAVLLYRLGYRLSDRHLP